MRKLVIAAACCAVAALPANAATLFDQTSAIYENRYVSNDFEAVYDAYDAAVVDDFTLAAGAHLTSVQAALVGFTSDFVSFDNVDGYTVNIYSSLAAASANLTGDIYSTFIRGTRAVSIGTFLVTTHPTDPTGLYDFPVDVTLGAGTYFLSVVASNSDAFNGEIGVAVVNSGDAVITNPGMGYGQGNPIGLARSAGYRIDGDLTAAVPEIDSWAMFIGGFGLIGTAMRRRRTSVSFA